MNACDKFKLINLLSFILTVIINPIAIAHQTAYNTNLKLFNSETSISSNLQKSNFALISKRLSFVFQLGGFDVTQGKTQNINIDGLIGDRFKVDDHHALNYLIGVGLFIDGLEQEKFKLLYGVNAFYFANTQVEGDVIQEQLFNNLAYHYSIRQIPIFIAAKALIYTNSNKYNISLDFGMGPNFIKTYDFKERSLDGGVTIPDEIFSGQSNVVFSASVGVGIRINNVLNQMPAEFSYRFFYLGKGKLNKLSDQVQNTLTTGSTFANALIFSISV